MKTKHKVSFVISAVLGVLALLAAVCFIILQAGMPMDGDIEDASLLAPGLALAMGISLLAYGVIFWAAVVFSAVSAVLALATAGAEFGAPVRWLSRVWIILDFVICAAISVASLIL